MSKIQMSCSEVTMFVGARFNHIGFPLQLEAPLLIHVHSIGNAGDQRNHRQPHALIPHTPQNPPPPLSTLTMSMSDTMNTNGGDVLNAVPAATPFDETGGDYGGFDPNYTPEFVAADDPAAAGGGAYGFQSAEAEYAQSPFEPEMNGDYREEEGQRQALDDAIFASGDGEGSILPPPSDMPPEEGAAFREWRR